MRSKEAQIVNYIVKAVNQINKNYGINFWFRFESF